MLSGKSRHIAGKRKDIMRIRTAICALLLCLGCTSLVSAQRVEREFIVNAMNIKLSADRSTLALSDPVIIKYTLTNTSKVGIPISELDWVVRREDGKPVTDAPEGARRKEARRAAKSMNVVVLLGAGVSRTAEETVSRLYVMDELGVYLVSVEMGVTDEIKTDFIKSNTIRITIK
jgi:hypothetical protein